MPNDPVFALRATLEATLPRPGTLVVSSPRPGDGATQLACNLAQAFAAGDLRTLLLAANPCLEETALALGSNMLPLLKDAVEVRRQRTARVAEQLEALALTERIYRSSARIAPLFTAFRERYDVVVVAASEILEGALDLARRADGVLLAVRHKRLPRREDGETVATLRRVGVQLLGIVTTDYRSRAPQTSRRTPLLPKPMSLVDVAPEQRAASAGT
jgi:Mrp family chromosome partitioning ATPase